jgi:hypothetical protein
MANQIGYDVQADLEKAREFAKMIKKRLKQHMRTM